MIRHPNPWCCHCSSNVPRSLTILGMIVVLATILAGCTAAHTFPGQYTSAAETAIAVDMPVRPSTLPALVPVSHPDAQPETLQELIARTIAPDITGTRSYLIAYTVVEDGQNLYRGTSASNGAIRQCWLYQAGSSQPCSSKDIGQAFSGQAQPAPWPRMRFALAYTQADKVLVLLDYFHDHSTRDRVDGYRIVLTREHGTWRELSRRQVSVDHRSQGAGRSTAVMTP